MRNGLGLFDTWMPTQEWFSLNPVHPSWAEETPAPRTFVPSCEVEEKKKHYLITVDVPGVAKEDIHIDVDKGRLIVRAERKQEASEEGAKFFTERRYGLFERVFELGEHIDTENIDAAYKDGVLKIALAKIERAQPRKVEVRSETKGGLFDGLLKGRQEKPLN